MHGICRQSFALVAHQGDEKVNRCKGDFLGHLINAGYCSIAFLPQIERGETDFFRIADAPFFDIGNSRSDDGIELVAGDPCFYCAGFQFSSNQQWKRKGPQA